MPYEKEYPVSGEPYIRRRKKDAALKQMKRFLQQKFRSSFTQPTPVEIMRRLKGKFIAKLYQMLL